MEATYNASTGRFTDGQGIEDMQAYHASVDHSRTYSPREVQRLRGTITRLRLLSDYGYPYWDVSYCHATLPDGRIVPVSLAHSIPKRNSYSFLIRLAKNEGYNAKALGLLDRGNWSTLQ